MAIQLLEQNSVNLQPGDCLVFDNTRIVHSRTEFTGAGTRHLQGCYGDLDGAYSTLRRLRHRFPASVRRDASGLDADGVVDFIGEIFRRRGADDYLGEPVSMAEHMLQAAWHAEQEGAPDELVAAALLHDIGHFASELPASVLGDGADNHHQDTGAEYWLLSTSVACRHRVPFLCRCRHTAPDAYRRRAPCPGLAPGAHRYPR